MPQALPERSRIYGGRLTDSTIWDRFQLRPDDVFVVTPPKCGTTWTQAILLMLIHGSIGMDKVLDEVSLWLDCGFRDVDERAAMLAAQPHRRCIKSHTPFDGIPYDPSCTYFAVYRHPLDVHFSMRRFALSMNVDLMNDRFPDDVAEGFRMYLDDRSKDGGNDDMTLDSITYHYQSFRRWAHLPNVHLVHYADLQRDLRGQVQRLAGIIGCEHPESFIDAVVEGARFDTMKRNARETVREKGSVLDDPASFFASGTSNKWERHLTPDQVACYDRRVRELLPEQDLRWLEWGSAA
ncbi:sulfotransferase domain-containing protein [Defluviimonas sp. WL0002]|uniref:Sulfotransferase domain-containing protein n=1 Tax=Albidovulum marisflavi TaxID=2984159 RepID=A0ABT2ZAC6_9RHOB|nr:sulfotransferase domain-containing protein [Defluviimonas sp. WL0002]MCV2868088.1 sulfotransferase domain-containing protein [Defluviimonas sp. WL0002]